MSIRFGPLKLRPGTQPKQPAPSKEQRTTALLALVKQGRLADAETAARALVSDHSDNGTGWMLLAAMQLAQGKDGLEAAQKAVACMPQDEQAICNLGRAWHDRRELAEAIAAYRQALQLRPTLLPALVNLGIALRESGDLAGSDTVLRQAAKQQPNSPEAFNELGVTLTAAGQLDAAYQCLRQALQLRPNFVPALLNMSQALGKGRRFDLAAAALDRVLALDPVNAKAHLGRGIALRQLGLLEEASQALERALQLQPSLAEAHFELGLCRQGLGLPADALACYERARAIARNDLTVLPAMMFSRHYLPLPAPQDGLAEARAYGEAAREGVQAFEQWNISAEAQRRLRVGLVSGDLRAHPVGYFLQAVLTQLTDEHGTALEFVAYHNFQPEDDLSANLKRLCTAWHNVADWDDQRLAQQIHNDAVDILIDLAGHTTHNRVAMFAWRPAPVQLSWLGYFATTGLAEMDYLLADPYTVPQEHEDQFTETVWRLPATRMCFTPPSESVAVSVLPAQASAHVTFGCFNQVGKINDSVVATWSRILHRVPESRLFLKAQPLAGESARRRLIGAFAEEGISDNRLIFEGGSPRRQYLESYHRIDIGLDPFPYTGGTTTVESLWMGVPVLTLAGPNLISRQGLALMNNAGLPDWVASDADDYVERAVAFANDLPALAALRGQLRAQVLASPLFDAQTFARHFEAALRGMWTRWCERQVPSL